MPSLCPECDEIVDDYRYHPDCCPHEDRDIDLALGYGGDPAAEDPERGWCMACGAHVRLAVPDEDGYAGWETF